MIIARSGDAAFYIVGKKNFDVAMFVVLGEHLGATLFEFADHLGGVAFHGEIEIAKGSAGDEVADRATREIDVVAQCCSKLLNTQHGSALFGREPAFEQKHII